MPYSSVRTSYTLVVLHTGEGILKRDDMARFLDNNPDASAHAASDATGVSAPLVPYSRAAWTAGPTANRIGLQIEMCAFAVMSREQWLSESAVSVWIPWLNANRVIQSPMSMLRHTANWAREVCDTYGIPKVKVSSSSVRNGAKGICGHADTSAAFGETNHVDPGSNFPWDVFIDLVNGDDVALSEDDISRFLDRFKNEVLAAGPALDFRFDGRNLVDIWRETLKQASAPKGAGGSVSLTSADLDAIAQRVIDFQKKQGN
jgi:hypothetical protein